MAAILEADALLKSSTSVFDDATMKKVLPADVYGRFTDNLVTGEPTSEPDQKIIAYDMFKWSRSLGAVSFSHWFFPMRGGSGATGGQLGALKMDAFVDLVWSSDSPLKVRTMLPPALSNPSPGGIAHQRRAHLRAEVPRAYARARPKIHPLRVGVVSPGDVRTSPARHIGLRAVRS